MARIAGDNKPDELDGTTEADLIIGRGGNDDIDGNEGNDELRGGNGADVLDGDTGSDTLFGGLGRDDLDGGNGADLLIAGDGNDTLAGDNGDDRLVGGVGDDIFKFESRDGDDIVRDFEIGSDRVLFDIDGLNFKDLTIRDNAAGDAVITWDDPAGSSIRLDDVSAADLSRGDFIFDA